MMNGLAKALMQKWHTVMVGGRAVGAKKAPTVLKKAPPTTTVQEGPSMCCALVAPLANRAAAPQAESFPQQVPGKRSTFQRRGMLDPSGMATPAVPHSNQGVRVLPSCTVCHSCPRALQSWGILAACPCD